MISTFSSEINTQIQDSHAGTNHQIAKIKDDGGAIQSHTGVVIPPAASSLQSDQVSLSTDAMARLSQENE